MEKDRQFEALKKEVIHLFECIQKVKEEIASIKHPDSDFDHFSTVADQLDAIVSTTEHATSDIIEATESILNAVNTADETKGLNVSDTALGEVAGAANKIFEACSFHDITGQRISRIVKTMDIIEQTLNSLVAIVGKQGLSALAKDKKEMTEKDETGLEMNGPALDGEGVSQKEIDKLFD